MIKASQQYVSQDIRTYSDLLTETGTDEPKELASKHERGAARHQAIFSLDHATYQKIINACSIKKSLISHRETDETQQPIAGRAWYG